MHLGLWYIPPLTDYVVSPLTDSKESGGHSAQAHHLDVGVLDQAELFLDLVQLFLLPPDVGLQDPRPLLQLVLNGLEHAELCRKLQKEVKKQAIRS